MGLSTKRLRTGQTQTHRLRSKWAASQPPAKPHRRSAAETMPNGAHPSSNGSGASAVSQQRTAESTSKWNTYLTTRVLLYEVKRSQSVGRPNDAGAKQQRETDKVSPATPSQVGHEREADELRIPTPTTTEADPAVLTGLPPRRQHLSMIQTSASETDATSSDDAEGSKRRADYEGHAARDQDAGQPAGVAPPDERQDVVSYGSGERSTGAAEGTVADSRGPAAVEEDKEPKIYVFTGGGRSGADSVVSKKPRFTRLEPTEVECRRRRYRIPTGRYVLKFDVERLGHRPNWDRKLRTN
ncbi:hypothetical protein PR003_g2762 [Phytophthora rubi]|uniref:Uncharacterized protein n=1 Tax=Phytophthora rubi TaxID=129364 RepID=A0A6A4FRV8_9STRA|nr:hypothetical protein PR003_g2762 [Phytophthora rubi]